MADEDKPNEEAPGKPEPPKKRRSALLWIAISVAALAVLGGVGGFLALKNDRAAEPTASDEHAEPTQTSQGRAGAEPGGGKQQGGKIFDLDPFIVNLADTPEIRYLKVSIKLDVAEGSVGALTARLPQIRDSLLILLSSKTYDAVRTVEGKMELREEILQRVNAVLDANVVSAAYFTDFVAQ